MYNLGELVWIKNSANSSIKPGWALIVGNKKTKLSDDSLMSDFIVLIHGSCRSVSPNSIVSFNFLNRHLRGCNGRKKK
jgi:hypothetical protein